uniref:Uncharacterized protein n=1 Tax=Arundo donax TaxID=35708 RepID=A0A0A9G4J2_ARUDO
MLATFTKAWRSSSTARTGESCSMALELFAQTNKENTERLSPH